MTDFARFSEAEIADIAAMIAGRYDVGVWDHPKRETGPGYDRVLIWLVGAPDCYYRIERDANGTTHLMWCTPFECRLAVSGTLSQCLGMFRRL